MAKTLFVLYCAGTIVVAFFAWGVAHLCTGPRCNVDEVQYAAILTGVGLANLIFAFCTVTFYPRMLRNSAFVYAAAWAVGIGYLRWTGDSSSNIPLLIIAVAVLVKVYAAIAMAHTLEP